MTMMMMKSQGEALKVINRLLGDLGDSTDIS